MYVCVHCVCVRACVRARLPADVAAFGRHRSDAVAVGREVGLCGSRCLFGVRHLHAFQCSASASDHVTAAYIHVCMYVCMYV